jgi:hypothetical protein
VVVKEFNKRHSFGSKWAYVCQIGVFARSPHDQSRGMFSGIFFLWVGSGKAQQTGEIAG